MTYLCMCVCEREKEREESVVIIQFTYKQKSYNQDCLDRCELAELLVARSILVITCIIQPNVRNAQCVATPYFWKKKTDSILILYAATRHSSVRATHTADLLQIVFPSGKLK